MVRILFFTMGLLGATSALAETVWVDDMLRVGVRSQPASREAPISVVTTGAELEVMERQDGYMRVRTANGVEGWVNSIYVSSEAPARLRLERVQGELKKLQGEMRDLRGGGAAAIEENERLSEQVSHLLEENAALHTRISNEYSLNSRAGSSLTRYSWAVDATAMIALFLFGIWLGVRWHKQRIVERFGGLEP